MRVDPNGIRRWTSNLDVWRRFVVRCAGATGGLRTKNYFNKFGYCEERKKSDDLGFTLSEFVSLENAVLLFFFFYPKL